GTTISGNRYQTGFDSTAPTNPSNFFIQSVTFSSGGVGMSVPALAPPQSRAHSLLNRPFLLLPNDMYALGGYDDPAYLGTEYIFATAPSEAASTFLPIVTRGGNTTVYTVEYGSGHVVICADGVGQAISEPVGLGKDSGGVYNGRCGQIFMAAHPEDLKFAYNIISLGSEHTTFHKNARRSGYSFAEIGAPLVPLWTFGPVPNTSGKPNDSSPAILDDMVFSVGMGKLENNNGTGTYQITNDDDKYYLRALDLSPTRDRDMDGDPDDGLRDNSLGAPFDVLWQYPLDGPASPPTAAYAPINGNIVPAVFIVTKLGTVLGFDASNYPAGEVAAPEEYFTNATTQLVPFTATINANGNIPAPTYAGGSLYVGGGDGAIHVRNMFATGSPEWKHPAAGATGLGPASAPVVGYFFDPTSGATEQIAYLATFGNSPSNPGFVRSYPLRSFNEVLNVAEVQSPYVYYRTRSTSTNIADITWSLSYTTDINLTPAPVPLAAMAQVQNPGRFRLDLAWYNLNIRDTGATVIADYTLDFWTPPAAPTPFRQIGIDHPATTDYAGISGSPAVGKNDTLYFGTENGCFYAVKEMGRGTNAFAPQCVKWRWYIGDPPAQTMLGLTGFTPANVKIVGSPVIVGDMVYFAMNDGTQGYILAFKSDPVFTVQLKQWPIKIGAPLSVQQIDMLKDPTTTVSYTGAAAGDAERASAGTPFLIDYDSGKLTFINFRTRSGQELSASADFQVIYTWDDPSNPTPPAITELHSVLAPTTPDKWNNLAWFIKLTGGIASSPVVMGKVLYVGCNGGILCSMDLDKIRDYTLAPGQLQKPWLDGYLDPKTGYAWADQVAPPNSPVCASVAGSTGRPSCDGVPRAASSSPTPVTIGWSI
ncbi:MAG: hypothetical protein NTU88_12380, partial [Armatimonadetes bacterium]|nr:hypothetical protein [Armatimonadota bacterium]